MTSSFCFKDDGPVIKADLLRLTALLEEVGRARGFVRDRLRGWGLEDLAGDCALVVSELVANAITHGRDEPARCDPREAAPGLVVVRLRLTASRLFAEVNDDSVKAPKRRVAADSDEDGRGLLLVEQLTCHWGWRLARDSKCVWACWELERRGLSPVRAGE